MNPSFDIPKNLVDNGGAFSSSYFSSLELRPAKDPLIVDGEVKDYLFPTLYADVRCAQAILHCSYAAAKDVLTEALGPEALPPRMLGGRAIVAISCYEYRCVRGVRPYNEIAIAIPVRLNGSSGAPVLGAFSGGPDSGYHIVSMPVTSDENRQRGHHFWNLPKITRRIDFEEGEGRCRFDSYNQDGEIDISLTVPTEGKVKHMSVTSFLATKKDGRVMRNPTAFDGDFAVVLDAATLVGAKAGKAALSLGAGEASDVLRRLGAELRPLQTRYAASMNSYFDLPRGAHKGE
jgi:hypothetical protein